jgi:hypothetical protein
MSKTRRCYGIIARYPLSCTKGDKGSRAVVCTPAGKVDMAATDAKILRAARAAVPRIPRDGVDSGAGGVPGRGNVWIRDLEFDSISMKKGLSATEKKRLAKALRKVSAEVVIRKDSCR